MVVAVIVDMRVRDIVVGSDALVGGIVRDDCPVEAVTGDGVGAGVHASVIRTRIPITSMMYFAIASHPFPVFVSFGLPHRLAPTDY